MGSFIVQDCIAKQSIPEGSPIKLAILMEHLHWSTANLYFGDTNISSHPVPDSQPNIYAKNDIITGFLDATTDDYGYCNLVQSETNYYKCISILKYLKQTGFITEAGENEYHDLEVNFSKILEPINLELPYNSDSWLTLEEIWNAVYELISTGRVFVAGRTLDNNIVPIHVSYAWIHEATVANLIKLCEQTTTWSGKHMTRDVVTAKLFHNETGRDDLSSYHIRDNLNYCIGRNNQYQHINYNELFYMIEDTTISNGKSLRELITEYFLDECMIMVGLSLVNVPIEPSRYANQDYSNELGNAYSKLVADVATIIQRRHEDEL